MRIGAPLAHVSGVEITSMSSPTRTSEPFSTSATCTEWTAALAPSMSVVLAEAVGPSVTATTVAPPSPRQDSRT